MIENLDLNKSQEEWYMKKEKYKNEVNHIDGNKQNNHINNLEWCTSSENKIHAQLNGLRRSRKGENNSQAKLSIEIVRQIRFSYDQGESLKSLFDKYKHLVSKPQLHRIIHRINWKDD